MPPSLRDQEEIRRRVARARVARLATADARGRPHLVPICFALAAETLLSAVDEKPKWSQRLKRLDNIRANPRVSVLVDHYEEDWSRLWWVRVDGIARVVEDDGGRQHAVRLLQAKYEQYRRQPPSGAVVAVSITGWRGWAAS